MSEITLTNELTAWGETKTIAEWARDERATADAKIIAKRYESGNTPERAIAFDPEVHKAVVHVARENEHFAFGQLKTLAEWSRDVRCSVSVWTLRERIKSGWDVEKALSTPANSTRGRRAGPTHTLEAWGEQKSLSGWVADPRCGISIPTLTKRLAQGWKPEMAISAPGQAQERFKKVEAFGETKSALEWTRDARCQVTLSGLRTRLKSGVEAEKAISTPPTTRGGTAGRPYRVSAPIELNGKAMSLAEWSREPECVVSVVTLRKRINEGWSFEESMTTSTQRAESYAARKRPSCEYVEYSAFGESKPLYEWYRDPRCKVRKETLAHRIKLGYSMQDALKTKRFGLKDNKVLPRYRALGSMKTLPDWSRDPRCQVCLQDLNKRMRKGWKIEAALTTPPRDHDMLSRAKSRFITAFGETKTTQEWVKDPRSSITAESLNRRIRAGITPEIAITGPARDTDQTTGTIRRMGQPREAFGETKTLRQWIADPRCVGNREQVNDRLDQGWDLEKALTTQIRTKEEALQAMRDATKKLITAFGETKSLADWARDPRAKVCRETIGWRIRKGLPPEVAITAKLTGHLAKGKSAA